MWLLGWFWSCKQLKKHVTDKHFEERLDSEYESPYHYNSWVTGVYMAYLFNRNSDGKSSQIEWLFESNLRSFAYSKCSTALGFPSTSAAKAICLQELGSSGRDCYLMSKIWNLQKAKVAFKSWIRPWKGQCNQCMKSVET